MHGIEECVLAAQQGGAGLIVYNRKEGRALGEVTKFMVYNARKRQEGQIDRQTDGRAGGRAGRAAAQADRCMDGWNGWMGGGMDGTEYPHSDAGPLTTSPSLSLSGGRRLRAELLQADRDDRGRAGYALPGERVSK